MREYNKSAWGYCSKDCYLDTTHAFGVLRVVDTAHVLSEEICNEVSIIGRVTRPGQRSPVFSSWTGLSEKTWRFGLMCSVWRKESVQTDA